MSVLVAAAVAISWGCRPAADVERSSVGFHIERLLGQPFPSIARRAQDAGRLSAELARLYQARNFEPLWVGERGLSLQARAAIEVLDRAAEHGLVPEHYLDGILAPDNFPFDVARASNETKARLELGLSFATMQYIKDVHEGRFSPRELDLGLDIMHDHKDLGEEVERLASVDDVHGTLAAFAPTYPQYRALKAALERYRRLADRDSWQPMASDATVHPGDIYEDADILRRRLRSTGDLAEHARSQGAVYDPVLVEAVKRFQHRHSLNDDGTLGPRTFAELNTPWPERVVQIVASMERWRWVPEHTDETALIANIPEYQLRAVTPEGDVELISRIVVGQTYRELRTPIFSGKLRYIDFRPYWVVPQSIIDNELSESLDEPGFFEKNGYEIVASSDLDTEALPVNEETIARVRRGALQLRQRPGPNNALGLVKFIFPNEHSVYFHSTPSQSLFRKEDRALSHGCVRVEEAALLAEWILAGQEEWDAEAIRRAMASGPTTRVIVEREIPVYILYLTAFVEVDVGDLHFGRDIYGLDADLAQRLEG